MTIQFKDNKQHKINYDVKLHLSSSKSNKTSKFKALTAFMVLFVLTFGAAKTIQSYFKNKNEDVYADVFLHEVYYQGDSHHIVYDDLNESDLLHVVKSLNLNHGGVSAYSPKTNYADDLLINESYVLSKNKDSVAKSIHDPKDLKSQEQQAHNIDSDVSSNQKDNLTPITDPLNTDPLSVDSLSVDSFISDGTSQSAMSDFEPTISPYSTTQYTVQPGDNLTKILNFLGLPKSEIAKFTTNKEIKKRFNKMRIGEVIVIHTGENNQISKLQYYFSLLETYTARVENDKIVTEVVTNEYDIETIKVASQIETTLDSDARKSGMDSSAISKLKNIFSQQINFNRDVRKGDSFAVIYEYKFINGKPYKSGDILAAELNVKGKKHAAILYESKDGTAGYYDKSGKSLKVQETFRRHPIDSPKITSKFGARFHPILKRRKAHNGVDYGARKGTPIYAPSHGKIEYASRKGSYGKAIVIQHSQGIKTLYAHLNNFAKGIKSGKTVKKGDVIGYVGSTGRSTGYHLHYEMYKNGSLVNPLTTSLPVKDTIPDNEKNLFLSNANLVSRELSLLNNDLIAKIDGKSVSR